jgi:hypothetical protein
VPLGSPLLETELYLVKSDNPGINLKEFENESENTRLIGRLLLGSKTRICYLNDKIEEFTDTGDQVLYYKKKLYYKGRVNKICKISGKLVNLNLIEKVGIFRISSFCYLIFLKFFLQIVL